MGRSGIRVLMFCQLFPPMVYGGGEVVFWNLAKTLAGRGHEVHVITQRVKGEGDFERKGDVAIRRVGLPVNYTGALSTRFLEILAYTAAAFFAGISIAVRRRIDVVHSNTYAPALSAQVCAAILRKPHVMTVHDVYLLTSRWFWRRWSRQRQEVGFLARFLGPFLESMLLRLPVSTIHTVSETSRRDLIRLGVNSPILVVPNGVEFEEHEGDGESPDPNQAIYVGRHVFYKNLEVVLRALSRVVQVNPDARLVVVGDGPMRPIWEKLTTNLGLTEHVCFYGRVPEREKWRLLRESAFLVLPSTVEGFGMVILEAFACKRPVLASDIGALREVVSKGVDGYLVDPGSEEEWADGMMRIFSNPGATLEMGLRGFRKLAGEYAMAQIVAEMEAVYRQVLAPEARG